MKLVLEGNADVLAVSRRLRVLWDVVDWLSGSLSRVESSEGELTDLQVCGLYFAVRTVRLLGAVSMLVQSGLVPEAIGLSRPVLEMAINFRYMADMRGDMPRRWWCWRAREEYCALKDLERNILPESRSWLDGERPRVEDAYESAKREMGPGWPARDWSGNETLSDRAEKTGLTYLRMRDYSLGSSVLHCGADSLFYFFRRDTNACRAFVGADFDRAGAALDNAVQAAFVVASTFNRVFGLVAPEELNELISGWLRSTEE